MPKLETIIVECRSDLANEFTRYSMTPRTLRELVQFVSQAVTFVEVELLIYQFFDERLLASTLWCCNDILTL